MAEKKNRNTPVLFSGWVGKVKARATVVSQAVGVDEIKVLGLKERPKAPGGTVETKSSCGKGLGLLVRVPLEELK